MVIDFSCPMWSKGHMVDDNIFHHKKEKVERKQKKKVWVMNNSVEKWVGELLKEGVKAIS
jgi:hypothetical protein